MGEGPSRNKPVHGTPRSRDCSRTAQDEHREDPKEHSAGLGQREKRRRLNTYEPGRCAEVVVVPNSHVVRCQLSHISKVAIYVFGKSRFPMIPDFQIRPAEHVGERLPMCFEALLQPSIHAYWRGRDNLDLGEPPSSNAG